MNAIIQIKSNAIGSDDIPIKFLKIILPFILPVVTHLFNKFITCSHFPDNWKTGLVTPIPKVSSPNGLNDWRPITILPAISKAFEILVADQIMQHVEDNNLLSECQSGFRRKHSTCTALTKVVANIRALCDNGDCTLHVLLDLSKAFDSVPHQILISKLRTLFSFSTSACTLISSYLKGRTQIVISDGRRSTPRLIESGVPQGAVLAPLLFSMFINDVTAAIPNFNFHLYADDLQIYAAAPKESLHVLIDSLNENLTRIPRWCASNKLSVNPTKTQAIIYANSARTRELTRPLPPITLQDQVIPLSTTHVKNLGLLMDPGLNWRSHANRTCARIYYGLRSLYAVSHHLQQSVRLSLVKALILPHFFYADIVMYPLQSLVLAKLQRALNACVRYVYRVGRHAHISQLRNLLVPGPLPKLYEQRVVCFIQRARLGLLPSYISTKFSWSRFDRCRINLPRARTQFGSKSVFILGASLWNRMPVTTRRCNMREQFKDLALLHLTSE